MPLQQIGVSVGGSFVQGVPAIQDMLANVRRVERLGVDSVWSGDHLIMYNPMLGLRHQKSEEGDGIYFWRVELP